MSSRRLREVLGADDAVIALRYLGVVFVGVSLAFGVGGAEEIVLLIRIVGCLGATGLVLLVLLVRAEEGGSEHRPLLALAIVAPALTLVLLLLGAGEDSAFAPFWWSLVGGLSGGVAVATRVASLADREAERSGNAYLLHVRRRRQRRPPEQSLAPIAGPMLLLGLFGLAGFAASAGLGELSGGSGWAFAGVFVFTLVLFMPLTLASMLMAMPLLGVRPETEPSGRVRRVWAGGSGVQPLPDLVATAVVSLIAIVSTSFRRSTEPTRGRGPASPEPPGADATRRHGR